MARSRKEKVELLDELKGAANTFTFTGEVALSDNSFTGATMNEKKTWKYVRANFGIKTSEGNTVYVQIMDGYDAVKNIIYCMNNNHEKLTIPFEHRLADKSIEQVRRQDLFRAALVHEEAKDAKEDQEETTQTRLEQMQFISGIDFESYLHDNLANGTKVTVRGDIEYQEYNGDIKKSYNVKAIYLAEDYEKDGETISRDPQAVMKQTYLVDDAALDRKWEKELTEEGKTIVSLYVPQYVSKRNGKELKKTIAMPQAVVVRTSDRLPAERAVKVVDKLFNIKKDTVREITLFNDVVEGYEQTTGEVENNEELQELIELGLVTQEEIDKQVTVRGNRLDELVFKQIGVRVDEGITKPLINDGKYSTAALIDPGMEEEENVEVEEDPFADVTEGAKEGMGADDFDTFFG